MFLMTNLKSTNTMFLINRVFINHLTLTKPKHKRTYSRAEGVLNNVNYWIGKV
jgi:hypothetical protein